VGVKRKSSVSTETDATHLTDLYRCEPPFETARQPANQVRKVLSFNFNLSPSTHAASAPWLSNSSWTLLLRRPDLRLVLSADVVALDFGFSSAAPVLGQEAFWCAFIVSTLSLLLIAVLTFYDDQPKVVTQSTGHEDLRYAFR
jgi:hypothetical protein